MTDFNNRSQSSARRSDYVWQYEYYDDEEPVSFEGLRAHRYSIVIGFWVGLAVFVIFMFFVLTLLTKTGAPHQDNPDSEKRHRKGNCALDGSSGDDDNEKAFSRPLLTESRSYFHFYITEEQDQAKQKADDQQNAQGQCKNPGECVPNGIEDIIQEAEDDGGNPELNLVLKEAKTDRECSFVPHFTIPNFVNLEHGSTLGEEDLLYEPSVTLERQARSQDNHCDLH